ncbi:MAG: Holliday junction branch migration protein RuvA [Chitinophagales bacterium]|nr:Holliday junction branch migration protein RuvA [Chitinophagales bacterium]
MIAYLKGTITYKSPTKIYVECGGVAYDVNISLLTYEKIERLQEATIYTYLHITELAHTMYGFADELEKEIFLMLISVNGIGPSTARLILSSMSAEELQKAIMYQEVSLLKRIKGIGPKTAQRMILELKDKVGKVQIGDSVASDVAPGINMTMTEEAISALTMLGFAKNISEKTIFKVLKDNPSVANTEELIKLCLKNL